MDNICSTDIGEVSPAKGANTGMWEVKCTDGAFGRYVYLIPSPSSANPLTLCEIDVYGDEGKYFTAAVFKFKPFTWT